MAESEFADLLRMTPAGLYCGRGDFYVDPWGPVERAVITHAHSDHARPGSRHYVAHTDSEPILRARLGADIALTPLPYGEAITVNGVRVSLHPAGHIRGSAQVRIESEGRVAVVTGDYKRGDDPTTATFEPLRCDLLVTESTFGLPVFRWPPAEKVYAEINGWWAANREAGKTSILYAYAVGKSQRVLAGLDPSIGPIYCHGAVMVGNEAYKQSGATFPKYERISEVERRGGPKIPWHEGIVLAPPSAHGTPWMRRFGAASTAMASGWMAIRGTRRRKAMDRGFVLSDHVDWSELLQTVRDCRPAEVWVTHGFAGTVARYLSEAGIARALPLKSHFVGETLEGGEAGAEEEPVAAQPEDSPESDGGGP